MDKSGVIRINSRVDLDESLYPQRFAPFLPRKTEWTRSFLIDVHHDYNHVHLETQVAAARSRFWIPQVRTALKSANGTVASV
jgi:hypothetical protein